MRRKTEQKKYTQTPTQNIQKADREETDAWDQGVV